MSFFIPPQTDVIDLTDDERRFFATLPVDVIRSRWQSDEGMAILAKLKQADFSRLALVTSVGSLYGKYDLRGLPLAGLDLSGKDFSDVDFFSADLSNCSFLGANLCRACLSQCDISGACFDWAQLDDALVDNTTFNSRTSFLGVKLHTINFMLATLLQDLAISQQRIQQLEQHHRLFALFLNYSSDYGRSISRYMLWVAAFVGGYAAVYWVLMGRSFLDCLYFSIVTFATVGYGDILPTTIIEKIIVMSEIGIGYLMGGLLVAILAKRVLG